MNPTCQHGFASPKHCPVCVHFAKIAELEHAFRCSCQIADHVSDECLMRGKCKERAGGRSDNERESPRVSGPRFPARWKDRAAELCGKALAIIGMPRR